MPHEGMREKDLSINEITIRIIFRRFKCFVDAAG